ncbi:hypothetical protein ACIQI8_29120 [Streptomyces sp. NPDC092369]|uniref:hypothetical protein n=1 Tax=Streptomyces sp. NPDC092369 TaxID=3366015 RepID=UPI0037FCFD79
MTTTRAVRAALFGCALAPVFLLVACTSGDDDKADAPPSPSPSRLNTQAQQEKKLTAQVQSALDSTVSENDSMVESGIERVAEGIHSEPDLTPGATYRITLICDGTGVADVNFTPKSTPAPKPVVCDGAMSAQRFTAATASLRIDVQGRSGATGMIGWRVERV